MNFIAISIPLALALLAGNAAADDPDLSSRVTTRDGWVGYQVPMVASAGIPCCYEWRGRNAMRAGCDLDGRSWSVSGRDGTDPRVTSDVLNVYLRVTHGRIDKVRAFAASCQIKDSDQVRWLDHVEATQSVALLARAAAASPSEECSDAQIAAMALHADAAATPTLAELSGATHPRKLREQALFWLGQARGAAGAQIVEHAAITDGDPEFRASAVFDLSQAQADDAYASIRRIARSDPSEHVREQALFWMAQMGDARAQDDITAVIASEASDSVREQAVFALSQLKTDDADAALIALIRGHYPRKVKEQALFWLGQSGSTRALEFLDDILSRQPARTARTAPDANAG